MTRGAHPAPELDTTDSRIVNSLQEGFLLVPRPYKAAAERLGLAEDELIGRLRRLLSASVLTRFGPFFDAEAMGGAFCLCAMAVPDDRFEGVVTQINARPEVAHNYQRTHRLNMWFVLATETVAGIERAAQAIEAETGLAVFRFPKEREFFIGFRVAA